MVVHHDHHRSTSTETSGSNTEGGDGPSPPPFADITGDEPQIRPGLRPIYFGQGSSITDVRLIAYIILFFVVLVVQVLIISNQFDDINQYTESSGFTSLTITVIATLVSYLVLAWVTFKISQSRPDLAAPVLFLIIGFLLFMGFWYINLSVKSQLYLRHIDYDGNGTIYLLASLISLILIAWLASKVSINLSYLTLIPIIWNLLLIYQWWFI